MTDEKRRKKIFVTGGNGFIGSFVVDELTKRRYKVKCLIQPKSCNIFSDENIEIVKGDLRNYQLINNAIKGTDVVIHIAAIVGCPNPKINYDINYIGSLNIEKACINNKVKRLIAISSISAIRSKTGPYGKSKKMMEKALLKNKLIKTTIIRPTMVYGIGSRGFMNIIKYCKMFPLFIPIVGNGKNTRQPIYVKDLAKVIVNSIESKRSLDKRYDLGGLQIISFNKLVNMISISLNMKKIKIHIPLFICQLIANINQILFKMPPFHKEHIRSLSEDTRVNIESAIKDLGYNPTPLEIGIKKTLKEINNN